MATARQGKQKTQPTEAAGASKAVGTASPGKRVRNPSIKQKLLDDDLKEQEKIRTQKKKQKEVGKGKKAARAHREEQITTSATTSTPTTSAVAVNLESDLARLERLLAEEKARNAAEVAALKKQNADLASAASASISAATRCEENGVGDPELGSPEWMKITPDGSIPRAKAGGKLHQLMGFDKDTDKLYVLCRDAIKRCARLRGLDYTKTWKQQDSQVVLDITNAAAEEVPFLKKFTLNWAGGRLLQSHISNTRGYQSGVGNPDSYVFNNRIAKTKIGAREYEEAQDRGDYDNGRLVKRKNTNRHYNRPNKFISQKQYTCSDPVKLELEEGEEIDGEDSDGSDEDITSVSAQKRQKTGKTDAIKVAKKKSNGSKRVKKKSVDDVPKPVKGRNEEIQLQVKKKSKKNAGSVSQFTHVTINETSKAVHTRVRKTKDVASVRFGPVKPKDGKGKVIAIPGTSSRGVGGSVEADSEAEEDGLKELDMSASSSDEEASSSASETESESGEGCDDSSEEDEEFE